MNLMIVMNEQDDIEITGSSFDIDQGDLRVFNSVKSMIAFVPKDKWIAIYEEQ